MSNRQDYGMMLTIGGAAAGGGGYFFWWFADHVPDTVETITRSGGLLVMILSGLVVMVGLIQMFRN